MGMFVTWSLEAPFDTVYRILKASQVTRYLVMGEGHVFLITGSWRETSRTNCRAHFNGEETVSS